MVALDNSQSVNTNPSTSPATSKEDLSKLSLPDVPGKEKVAWYITGEGSCRPGDPRPTGYEKPTKIS